MNLRDLEYFVAVAELKHFRKAAERCFVSQPALSGQLKKLEEELGLSLFQRHTREVQLTPAGQSLLKNARSILGEARIMTEAAQALRDPRTGPMKLGVIPTLAPYLMPSVIRMTRKQHPHLELFLSEMRTRDLLEGLAAGTVEAGILALPIALNGVIAEEILTEPFYLAVPTGHPLARKRELSTSDLAGQTLFLLEDGHCLKDHVLDVCNHVGAHEHPHFRGSSLETLRQMVGAGSGATLMPWLAVRSPIGQSPSIRYLPFSEPKPHRKVALAWRKGSPRDAFLKRWAGELRAALGKLETAV
jgi:LysR family hydrogen peroxide-inducible transcriptional activator